MSRNRWSKGRGVWRDKHMDVTAVAPAKASVLSQPSRIAHPVVKAPTRKCWRVVRLYTNQGQILFEDIGTFDGALEAIRLLSWEQGKARVLDPGGKVYADNYQPIEAREG